MPIRPENRKRYPAEWPQIRERIRRRAEIRNGYDGCEWCGAANHEPHPRTGSRVVCTVAHLDHTPEHCAEANLAYLCQRCHNRHDAEHRKGTRRRTRYGDNGGAELFTTKRNAIAERTMEGEHGQKPD